MDDFRKLQHWQDQLRSGDAVVGEISKRQADCMLDLVADGFATETDPYGDPWAPKKRPDGRTVLLGPTGQLQQFTAVREGKHRFVLVPGADYAAPHQAPRDGRRPRRMMVPTAERGLPDTWKQALSRQAVDSLRKHFNKR